MFRAAVLFTLVLCIPITNSQAAELVVDFEGVITGTFDFAAEGGPAIDFAPIPVGSSFTGTIAYDTETPPTDGGTGYKRYIDMPSSSSLTVNGHTFTAINAASAIVSSVEANFGFSGVSFSNQPMSLPAGWSVRHSGVPYFTVQFWNVPAQTRSLTLPSSQEQFPADERNLVLDFPTPLTVEGETYGGRVYIRGEITSLWVVKEVEIDVLPFSGDNNVNLNAKKPKPLDVAVFGAANFDVLTVLTETIGLGDPVLTEPGTGVGEPAAPTAIDYVDLDGDGELDLFLTFDVLQMNRIGAIGPSSTSLTFQGILENGGIVFGSDGVNITGVGGKGKGK